MNGATAIVVRHQLLVACFNAKPDGLEKEALIGEVIKASAELGEQVSHSFVEKQIKRLSEGGIGGARDLHKKDGRWHTSCMAPPAPIRVAAVVDPPPEPRDPELVREDQERAAAAALEAERPAPPAREEVMAKKNEKAKPAKVNPRVRVLEVLKAAGTWVGQDKLQAKVGYGTGPAVNQLLKEGVIVVAGAGRARLLSLASLKLNPLASVAAAVAKARRGNGAAAPAEAAGGGPLDQAAAALDAEIVGLEEQVAELSERLKRRKTTRSELGKLIGKFA